MSEIDDNICILTSNLINHNFYDNGTLQKILENIITNDIDKPQLIIESFYYLLHNAIEQLEQAGDNEEIEERTCYDKLSILIIDGIIFNIYSKIKNIEFNIMNNSLTSSTASVSIGQSNENLNNQNTSGILEKEKFRIFMTYLIDNHEFFDLLIKILDAQYTMEDTDEASEQVNYVIKTIEYIIRRENYDKAKFIKQKDRFIDNFNLLPLKPAIKSHIPLINRILFCGSYQKINKIILSKKNQKMNHIAIIRLFDYYNKGPIKKKSFAGCSVFGEDIVLKIFMEYVNTKSKERETMFKDNIEDNCLFDFIINYMIYHFLQVANEFHLFFEKNVVSYGDLEPQEFYDKFSKEARLGTEEFLMKLPTNLLNFLRDLNLIIYNSDINSGINTSGPIKTLFFLRFLLSNEIREYYLLSSNLKISTNNQNYTRASNYFKDLFFESSQLKYTKVSNFKQLQAKLIQIFEKVIKGERIMILRQDMFKFHITKHLLYQDYMTLRAIITDLRLDDREDPRETKIPTNVIKTLSRPKPKTGPPTSQNSMQANQNIPSQNHESLNNSLNTNQSLNQPKAVSSMTSIINDKQNQKIGQEKHTSLNSLVQNTSNQISDNSFLKKQSGESEEDSAENADIYTNNQLRQKFQSVPETYNRDLESKSTLKTINSGLTANAIQELKIPNVTSEMSKSQPLKQELKIPALSTNLPTKALSTDKILSSGVVPNLRPITENSVINSSLDTEDDKLFLKAKIEDNKNRLKAQELAYNEEKQALLNKINTLEEKNSLLTSNLSRKNLEYPDEDRNKGQISMSAKKQNSTNIYSDGLDDEYYLLCDEIEKVFKEMREADLAYVMHRRTYFPNEYI